MPASPDPESLAALTRSYGAYSRERSGLGLLLGECLLGVQSGMFLGIQLGWALTRAHRGGTGTWVEWFRDGKAMGHPAFVAVLLLPPVVWLAGKERLRGRYRHLGAVRMAEPAPMRRRRAVTLVLMGFIGAVLLLLLPIAWREGWNSGWAVAAAGDFAILFPLACWKWTAPGTEALVGLVFLILVSSVLLGAKGAFLLGLATMTLPAAFLGGLEGLMQHLEFKELERQLAAGARE
jgi:hypothetical protein